MQTKSKPFLLLPALLGLSLISGCATPNVGKVVAAQCPQPPLRPASLNQLPPEATVDADQLILSLLRKPEAP